MNQSAERGRYTRHERIAIGVVAALCLIAGANLAVRGWVTWESANSADSLAELRDSEWRGRAMLAVGVVLIGASLLIGWRLLQLRAAGRAPRG